MKTTKILKALYVLAFAILLSTNFSCALFDAELGSRPLPTNADGSMDFDKIEDIIIDDFWNGNRGNPENITFYAPRFVDVAAGLGLHSTDGDTETTYCIGAGYNHRISKDNYNGASYIRGFATQHWQNADDRESSITRVGVGYTYFDRINKVGDLDLTYGLDVNYGFGTVENFGTDEDFSEIAATLKIGANYEVSDRLDIGVTVPFASWAEQTFEAGGVEFKQDHTWFGLNKDNMIMAYGRIKLD